MKKDIYNKVLELSRRKESILNKVRRVVLTADKNFTPTSVNIDNGFLVVLDDNEGKSIKVNLQFSLHTGSDRKTSEIKLDTIQSLNFGLMYITDLIDELSKINEEIENL